MHAGGPLVPTQMERRDPGPTDVVIRVLWCGVCHSDLSMIENDWGFSRFPMMPGHEIVGEVSGIGGNVTRFKVGDLAAVGCMIDSCRVCKYCETGLEQYCDESPTSTFGAYERGTTNPTLGGFSKIYVVDERYALKVPQSLDFAGAAPLLCAGITTYSPLRRWHVGNGTTVGIVGIGGLGHIAIKVARAMGAHVVAITSSADKRADAMRLGAEQVIVSKNATEMRALAGRLDFILDTVSVDHDVPSLLELLRVDGTLCMVGIPVQPLSVPPLLLETKRRSIAGSIMGGIAETQEMLDFCGTHKISADVEVLPIDQVNEALRRLKINDVRYRFVLDL
jgi:alcohol dehydrogenase (NADP+)